MSRILPLPKDAVTQIHSSKQITSLQGVVLALLENSLDAGASQVDVIVDFRRGGCTLEDNGSGIPSKEFGADGGLGRMYHTSKFGADDDGRELYGSSGTYLASLAALSLLSVTSRHREHHDHATLVIHRGSILARHIPAPQSHELALAHGTLVTVRDLFGNMPVRVKQRALAAAGGAEDERAWQELKHGIAALLLAWARPCAIKLKDANCESKTLVCVGRSSAFDGALTEKTLNQLAGKGVKHDFRDGLPILFQVGTASQESRHKWVPVSASAGGISVRGAICLDPAPMKQCQFISIGIHPCATGKGHHDLYDVINRVVANSSFGAVDDATGIDEAEKVRREHDRRYKTDGYTQKQLQGRKSVDRWPMFVLKIQTSDRLTPAIAESTSEASLKAMVDLLEATATEWLTAHHFRPKQRRRTRNEEQVAPAVASTSPLPRASNVRGPNERTGASTPATPSLKRPATSTSATTSRKRRIVDLSEKPGSRGADTLRPNNSAYFDGLSRIKSGRGSFFDDCWGARKPATAPAGQAGTAVAPSRRTKHPFKLHVVEVGQLSTTLGSRPESGGTPHPRATCNTETGNHALTTSDDFGSVDSEAFREATEKAECDYQAPEEDVQRPGSSIVATVADRTEDRVLDWMDPITKQMYRVNSRTGVVLPTVTIAPPEESFAHVPAPSRQKAAINTSVSSAGHALNLAHRSQLSRATTEPRWLHGFLKDWDNPVFQRQEEERIPVVSFDGPGIDAVEAGQHRCVDHALTQHFTETDDKGTSKLSKAGLKQAKFIRQVDDKFMLCSMRDMEADGTQNTLVLVDQHAASERVILESLLTELCTPLDPGVPAASYTTNTGSRSAVLTTMLDRPQRFLISEKEMELFAKHAPHFANSGILYDLTRTATTLAASQVRETPREHRVTVRALPPGIAERCTLLPNLLIELLRSEVWTVTQSHGRTLDIAAGGGITDEHAWLRRIGSCPKGILEMLNSRACRSAIMFNDVLSVAQCEELLAELTLCAFPFMCAHGRVSMVPLVGLGGVGEGGFGCLSGPASASESFMEAFRAWKSRDGDAMEQAED